MIKKKLKRKIYSIREKDPKIELTKEILKGLAAGGFIVASFALPNLLQVFSLFGVKTARERYIIKRTIERLEKQKLINIYEKGDDMVIEITKNGNKKVLKYKINEMILCRPKKWDKKWRIITFDIPETKKMARNALNAKLKKLEIYPLQKSLFICPFECQNEIDFIGEFFNVRKFIKYFVVEKIESEDEDYLKRYYNIE
ncbi:hypothetical protein KJ763_02655 [Patescibacteria group bacterium]|nr:hypothetical protein [Patescibacteria group bacterium]